MAVIDLWNNLQSGASGSMRQPMTVPTGAGSNWFSQNAPSAPSAGQTAAPTYTSSSGVPALGLPPMPGVPQVNFQNQPIDAGAATGGSLRDQVIAKANAIGRPDIANNPDYWVEAISSKGPNVDWGYWTDRMQTANQGGGSGGMVSSFGGTNAQSGYGALPAGSLLTSNTTSPGSFGEPSEAQAMSSPGVQFALDEAQKAVERGAASKGTLLTGGTLKALAGYETGLAGQLYNDVFNRSLASAQFNQQTGLNNAYYGLAANNQNYNQLYNLAGLGQRAVLGA